MLQAYRRRARAQAKGYCCELKHSAMSVVSARQRQPRLGVPTTTDIGVGNKQTYWYGRLRPVCILLFFHLSPLLVRREPSTRRTRLLSIGLRNSTSVRYFTLISVVDY